MDKLYEYSFLYKEFKLKIWNITKEDDDKVYFHDQYPFLSNSIPKSCLTNNEKRFNTFFYYSLTRDDEGAKRFFIEKTVPMLLKRNEDRITELEAKISALKSESRSYLSALDNLCIEE